MNDICLHTHKIQKCYKQHYLVCCDNCKIFFHVPMKSLTFVSVSVKRSQTTTAITCPRCNTSLQGYAKRWHWWPSKMPDLVSRYERDMCCDFGKIINLQLHAPGRNLIFFANNTVAHIRGVFLSEDAHFRVCLSEFCDKQGNTYLIKPFSIQIASKNLLLYKLSDVMISEARPFVFLDEEGDYALLSRSCEFSARITYADPFHSFCTFKA